jgi:hypothetical protein
VAVVVDDLNLWWLACESFVGLTMLFLLLYWHGHWQLRIGLRFQREHDRLVGKGRVNSVFFQFYISMVLLAAVHLGEIFLWGLSIFFLGLQDSLRGALLLAGSTYTTVGFEADTMPAGWTFYPIFIAVSGLFSFAWTTARMMGMSDLSRQAFFQKHKIPVEM